MERIYFTRDSLPKQEQAFHEFLQTYPLYLDTQVVDHIREQEYSHLNDRSQVCLDYTGVGLFSHSQQALKSPSAALGLAYISANLATHALYTAEETEMMVRRRVLRYMNIDENEYAIVFTANTLSAFKLLGESYPFHTSGKLLLGYDHQCESRDALSECAKSKGAMVMNANVTWPSLKLDEADIKRKLQVKRKGALRSKGWSFHGGPRRRVTPDSDFSANQQLPIDTQGLMVYPVMSRGSGVKNPLQWIREAAQNGWHVLLDVSGLGARAMDMLGLNLFHPDFIVGSFYKVFGFDPTGFGCLVIKKSVMRSLGDSSRARAVGMVRIVSSATGPSSSHSPVESFSSVFASWNSIPSSSSSDPNSSEPSAELKHLHLYPGGLRRQQSLHQEDEVLNAQFEERFSAGRGCALPSDKISKVQSLAGLPKATQRQVQEIEEEVLPSTKGKWKEDELTKKSWVRSQSSPSSSSEHQFKDHTKYSNLQSRSEENVNASMSQNEGEFVGMWQSSRHCGKYYSEEQRRVSTPGNSRFQRGLIGSEHAPRNLSPRFDRTVDHMPGLRYLEIPKQGWGVHQGILVDEENFLSRDFGKKSPLMLILPRGFDSPGVDRTPPSSRHEALQEVLVGSLPETPSSVSAPCSPYYPRLLNQEETIWQNPELATGNPPGTIVCCGLDHADKIGLTRINFRLRALINWLISSFQKLRHPTKGYPHVVLIYGPLCQVDRSSTVAFNIADSDGQLVDPILVQRLADRNNISLGTSILQGSFTSGVDEKVETENETMVKRGSKSDRSEKCNKEGKLAGLKSGGSPRCIDLARQKWSLKTETLHTGRFLVLCATLGFLSSFSDVYRLWEFVALFLDSEFVNREQFHYRALNQETILM